MQTDFILVFFIFTLKVNFLPSIQIQAVEHLLALGSALMIPSIYITSYNSPSTTMSYLFFFLLPLNGETNGDSIPLNDMARGDEAVVQ